MFIYFDIWKYIFLALWQLVTKQCLHIIIQIVSLFFRIWTCPKACNKRKENGKPQWNIANGNNGKRKYEGSWITIVWIRYYWVCFRSFLGFRCKLTVFNFVKFSIYINTSNNHPTGTKDWCKRIKHLNQFVKGQRQIFLEKM